MHRKEESFITYIRGYVEKYERRASVIALAFAFFIDSVTLVRIDFLLTEALLVLYLVIAGVGIFFLVRSEEGGRGLFSSEGRAWLLILIQFAFGGLFGRYLIYYSRSGALFTSWPFLLLLFILIVGNELAKKFYLRVVFYIGMFFTALYFFLIFFIPVVIGMMGTTIFIVSGVIALIAIAVVIDAIERVAPGKIKENGLAISLTIFGIFVATNVLYFTHIIPPLPLGLKEVDVYHSVKKTSIGYEVMAELQSANFLKEFLHFRKTISILEGQPVYVYSAVFAPTDFGTNVVHHWFKYAEDTKEWIDSGKISFSIVGGEDRGYRGYSVKSNVTPGLWKVNIETENGLIIGYTDFYVQFVTEGPILVPKEL